jgi:DUF4097 and DUF4098 domain-containing protein YvlB
MHRAHRTVFWLAPACLVLVASGCVYRASHGEYDKSYPVTGRPSVHVRTKDGGVRVVTSDTQEVSFHVKYESTSGNPQIDSQQRGDSVELDAEFGSTSPFLLGGHRRMDIEVHMPRDANLQVESKDGGVDVAAVNGKVVIHTTDGGVRASQLNGTIEITSNDGGIHVDTATGNVKLHTDDGSIGVDHVDGKCEAVSNDGSIHVDGRFDGLDVRSGDGSVVARIESGSVPTSAWRVRTSDGSVHVALPPDFKANLAATTNQGSITLESPFKVEGNVSHSKVEGALNGGGPTFVIHTTDGSIHVGAI